MTIDEWCKTIYLSFIEAGWKMNEIDELDIEYWIEITEWKAIEDERKSRMAYLGRSS